MTTSEICSRVGFYKVYTQVLNEKTRETGIETAQMGGVEMVQAVLELLAIHGVDSQRTTAFIALRLAFGSNYALSCVDDEGWLEAGKAAVCLAGSMLRAVEEAEGPAEVAYHIREGLERVALANGNRELMSQEIYETVLTVLSFNQQLPGPMTMFERGRNDSMLRIMGSAHGYMTVTDPVSWLFDYTSLSSNNGT